MLGTHSEGLIASGLVCKGNSLVNAALELGHHGLEVLRLQVVQVSDWKELLHVGGSHMQLKFSLQLTRETAAKPGQHRHAALAWVKLPQMVRCL